MGNKNYDSATDNPSQPMCLDDANNNSNKKKVEIKSFSVLLWNLLWQPLLSIVEVLSLLFLHLSIHKNNNKSSSTKLMFNVATKKLLLFCCSNSSYMNELTIPTQYNTTSTSHLIYIPYCFSLSLSLFFYYQLFCLLRCYTDNVVEVVCFPINFSVIQFKKKRSLLL